MIEGALTRSLKKNFSMATIHYQFPFGFEAGGVECENIFSAKRVEAQLNLFSLFQGRLGILYALIENPVVTIEQKEKAITGEKGTENPFPVSRGPAPDPSQKFEVVLGKVMLHNGRIIYRKELLDKTYHFIIEEARLHIEQLVLPLRAVKTKFNLTGRLTSDMLPFGGNRVEGSGWANISRKDMQAKLLIIEPNGNETLRADLVSRDNDLTVKGDVKIKQLASWGKKEGADSSSINDLVFDSLSNLGVEIGAQFSFKTKMDDFKLDAISFSGNVSANALPEVFKNTSP